MKMRFIGDIHGDVNTWMRITAYNDDSFDASVQVGDFGVGFGSALSPEFLNSFIFDDEEFTEKNRFIRGNHDWPEKCKQVKGYIPDGTIEGNVMYIGGAGSIDRAFRTEGVSWWSDEELSDEELAELVVKYKDTKPDVLVTHECTESFATRYMMPYVNSKLVFKSRTREALDAMYSFRVPELHVFGHWHYDVDKVDPMTSTRMVCVNINRYVDIEI